MQRELSNNGTTNGGGDEGGFYTSSRPYSPTEGGNANKNNNSDSLIINASGAGAGGFDPMAPTPPYRSMASGVTGGVAENGDIMLSISSTGSSAVGPPPTAAAAAGRAAGANRNGHLHHATPMPPLLAQRRAQQKESGAPKSSGTGGGFFGSLLARWGRRGGNRASGYPRNAEGEEEMAAMGAVAENEIYSNDEYFTENEYADMTVASDGTNSIPMGGMARGGSRNSHHRSLNTMASLHVSGRVAATAADLTGPLAATHVERRIEQYVHIIGDRRILAADLISLVCTMVVGIAEGLPTSWCRERIIIALVAVIGQALCDVGNLIPAVWVTQMLLNAAVIPLTVIAVVQVFEGGREAAGTAEALDGLGTLGNVMGIIAIFLSLLATVMRGRRMYRRSMRQRRADERLRARLLAARRLRQEEMYAAGGGTSGNGGGTRGGWKQIASTAAAANGGGGGGEGGVLIYSESYYDLFGDEDIEGGGASDPLFDGLGRPLLKEPADAAEEGATAHKAPAALPPPSASASASAAAQSSRPLQPQTLPAVGAAAADNSDDDDPLGLGIADDTILEGVVVARPAALATPPPASNNTNANANEEGDTNSDFDLGEGEDDALGGGPLSAPPSPSLSRTHSAQRHPQPQQQLGTTGNKPTRRRQKRGGGGGLRGRVASAESFQSEVSSGHRTPTPQSQLQQQQQPQDTSRSVRYSTAADAAAAVALHAESSLTFADRVLAGVGVSHGGEAVRGGSGDGAFSRAASGAFSRAASGGSYGRVGSVGGYDSARSSQQQQQQRGGSGGSGGNARAASPQRLRRGVSGASSVFGSASATPFARSGQQSPQTVATAAAEAPALGEEL